MNQAKYDAAVRIHRIGRVVFASGALIVFGCVAFLISREFLAADSLLLGFSLCLAFIVVADRALRLERAKGEMRARENACYPKAVKRTSRILRKLCARNGVPLPELEITRGPILPGARFWWSPLSRPMVSVDLRLVTKFSAKELESVLAHEISHWSWYSAVWYFSHRGWTFLSLTILWFSVLQLIDHSMHPSKTWFVFPQSLLAVNKSIVMYFVGGWVWSLFDRRARWCDEMYTELKAVKLVGIEPLLSFCETVDALWLKYVAATERQPPAQGRYLAWAARARRLLHSAWHSLHGRPHPGCDGFKLLLTSLRDETPS